MAEREGRTDEPLGGAAGGEATEEEAPGGAKGATGEGPLGDAVADLLGKILRRGRVEVERAARKGRERLALRQMRGDRDRMYQKLGKEARQLLEAGELDHPGLRRGMERIRELEARILEAEDIARGRGEDVEEPPEGDSADEP